MNARVAATAVAARVLNGRDGVLEDKLLVRARFEKDGKLIKALDASGQFRTVHQVYRHRILLATNCVEKRILYVLGRFGIHFNHPARRRVVN